MLRLLKKIIQDLAKISQDKFIIRSYRDKSSRSYKIFMSEDLPRKYSRPMQESFKKILHRNSWKILFKNLLLGDSIISQTIFLSIGDHWQVKVYKQHPFE